MKVKYILYAAIIFIAIGIIITATVKLQPEPLLDPHGSWCTTQAKLEPTFPIWPSVAIICFYIGGVLMFVWAFNHDIDDKKKPDKNDDNDMGAWEVTLPPGFDHKKFHEDAECGAGAFWLVCVEDEQKDFKRYRGVLLSTGKSIPEWCRLSIDLGTDYAYINAGHDQKLTREQIAFAAMKGLGGTEMFKDGVKVA